MPGGLEIDWRTFSLEQVNNKAGEGRSVWDRPEGFASQGLDALAAAEAARRMGDQQAWERFHMALLVTRHTGRKEKLTLEVVERCAEQAGLDVARLRQEMAAPDILQPLARSHAEAVEQGVFGTPTLFFENGRSGYLKMLPAPTGDEALRAWEHVRALVEDLGYIAEVKRPQAPKRA